MKEMLGGCCVCSDERGWTENPLVYCDGQGCTVAVHQACYGIVTVPTGPWYCRKCESQERSARVRCELCPSRDGALKRTDQAGWAHVVCALYIPEVRFGNVTTMEPIILQLIPPERFNKSCYICEEQGRGNRANVGACMQCNKTGCRQQFHVTCAQALGLLCEEAGNYLDNVKYCGYCQHHYSKLKKGGNVKTIPPYKPIPTADNGSSDSSPEKEAEAPVKTGSGKRKSSGSKSTANSKSKSNASPSLEINGVAADDKSGSSGRNTPKDNSTSSSKFTTSNFVETIVTQSESVFGHDGAASTTTVAAAVAAAAAAAGAIKTAAGGANSAAHKNIGQVKSSNSSTGKVSSHTSKKRKTGARTPTVIGNENSNQSASSEASGSVVIAVNSVVQQAVPSNNVQQQPTITEATSLSTTTEPEKLKKVKVESPIQSSSGTPIANTEAASTTPVIMAVTQTQPSVLTQQSPTTSSSNSIVVSVPLTATALPNTVQSVVTSAPTLYQQLQPSISTTAANPEPRSSAMACTERFPAEEVPVKRSRSQSSDKQEKVRKPKRGASNNQQPSLQQQSQTTASSSSIVSSVPSAATVMTTSKRGGRNNHQTPPPAVTVAPVPSIIQGPTSSGGHFSGVGTGTLINAIGPAATVKESPPSSPGSESMSSSGPGRRKRKMNVTAAVSTPSASTTPTTVANTALKEENNVKLFQNGVSAPHMLGNQLNPTSTMAQKMSDTLSQELEAHSIFTEASNSNTNLVGPQLHSRVIASIRSSQSSAPPTSFSSVFTANGNNANANTTAGTSGTLGGGAIPQSLDQLLERQWEQGSQFLMEQAQHFDIASLLSCLHQLRAENLRLEEHVNNLLQRRDHLLAVNARLAIPLTTQPSSHPVNNIHPTVNPSHPNVSHSEVPPGAPAPVPRVNREARVNNTYMPHSSSAGHPTTLENGLPPDPSPPAAASLSQYQHRGSLVAPQPSPTIRHSPAAGGYLQGQPSNIVSPAPANTSGVVRNSSVTPDPLRGVPRSAAQSSSSYMPAMYQPTMPSLTGNQVGSVHNLHSHGPSPTSHGPSSKPS
ncbi:PREDICTED: protein AF-10-like [Dinoponera quadriceps]|uniref:Protein AF-10-like n=1 Tax=Dinoponera quadriceps TaxID=609295 RepID=A0A6P3Y5I4_DINQU|nr:PREDICTED: protein AF-10-like [Dinoponera quadriceps]